MIPGKGKTVPWKFFRMADVLNLKINKKLTETLK